MSHGIDPELAALLNESQRAYAEGLEDANPIPSNGRYTALLTKIVASGVDTTDKTTGVKSRIVKFNLSLKILGDPTYHDYVFRWQVWGSNSRALGQLSTFAVQLAGRPVPTTTEMFSVLAEHQGDAVFEIEIARERSKTTGREYEQIYALRRVVEDGAPAA